MYIQGINQIKKIQFLLNILWTKFLSQCELLGNKHLFVITKSVNIKYQKLIYFAFNLIKSIHKSHSKLDIIQCLLIVTSNNNYSLYSKKIQIIVKSKHQFIKLCPQQTINILSIIILFNSNLFIHQFFQFLNVLIAQYPAINKFTNPVIKAPPAPILLKIFIAPPYC